MTAVEEYSKKVPVDYKLSSKCIGCFPHLHEKGTIGAPEIHGMQADHPTRSNKTCSNEQYTRLACFESFSLWWNSSQCPSFNALKQLVFNNKTMS